VTNLPLIDGLPFGQPPSVPCEESKRHRGIRLLALVGLVLLISTSIAFADDPATFSPAASTTPAWFSCAVSHSRMSKRSSAKTVPPGKPPMHCSTSGTPDASGTTRLNPTVERIQRLARLA